MRFLLLLLPLLFLACSKKPDTPPVTATPMRPGGPDWEAVDKTVQRVKDRAKSKPRLVETSRTTEQGFAPMTDEEYEELRHQLWDDIHKSRPDLSEFEVDRLSKALADQKRQQSELRYRSTTSSTYEWKSGSK